MEGKNRKSCGKDRMRLDNEGFLVCLYIYMHLIYICLYIYK